MLLLFLLCRKRAAATHADVHRLCANPILYLSEAIGIYLIFCSDHVKMAPDFFNTDKVSC